MKIMIMLKRIIGKTVVDKTTDEMVSLAVKNAQRARELADQKIENLYAQLDKCGDKWFLSPHSSIDECKEEEK